MNRLGVAVVAVVCLAVAITSHAQQGLSGKWQGTTVQGRPIGLELKVSGAELTGTFTRDQQSANIAEGKVDDKMFSFAVQIDGKTATFVGRLTGEAIELTLLGSKNAVTLTRAK